MNDSTLPMADSSPTDGAPPGETILVVDDDEPTRKALRQLLVRRGYRVRDAASGEAGMAHLASADFVLLDLELPGRDGHSICREIKSQRPDLPVLVVTGSERAGSLQQAFDAGADDYIAKPFASLELLSRLEARLRLRRMEQALRMGEERAQRFADRMRAVATTAAGVLGTRTVAELDRVLRQACSQVLPYDVMTFGLYDEAMHALRYVAAWENDRAVPGGTFALAGRPTERVVRERRSTVQARAAEPGRSGTIVFGNGQPSESILRTPILSGDRVLGVVSLQSFTPELYGDEDVEVLEAVAAVVATALRNIELLEAEARREQEFTTLAENAPDLILRLDRTGTVLYANAVVEAATGLAPSAVIGRRLRELALGDAVADAWHEALERVFEAGAERPLEYALPCAAGGQAYHEARLAPERGAGGAVESVLVVSRDVSRQKEAERTLRESEERYRRFFEDDISGDYVATADGRILDCNAAFLRIFGLRSIGAARASTMAALHVDADAHRDVLDRVRAQERLAIRDYEMRRLDGSPVHVITNVIGEFDAAGALVWVRGYVVDVTERKRLEEQLRQSQKIEAVGQLAGGIAHDFNNMLTAIVGNAQMLLLELPEPDDRRGPLLEIRSAAERSASLTRQLLAFSRRQILQPQVVCLAEIVLGMEAMLQRLIGEHIAFVTRLSEGGEQVRVDRGQMEQVLMNLVVNARDAMPNGGTVVVETGTAVLEAGRPRLDGLEVEPGRYGRLAVTDDGCGMSRDTLARAFDPFFTTKEVGKGTGLGLSTAYGIVKQSGGCILARSRPARGSSFEVYLPLAEATAEAAAPALAPSPAPHDGGHETVLVVEDEPSVRALVRQVLRRSGYAVLEAADGEDALRIAASGADGPDLVLTDVVMPGISGRVVAERLQASFPRLSVLFMSGYIDDAIVPHDVLETGAGFLQKPFTPARLLREVRAALDRAPSAG